jgi:clan AA aspartic protease
MMTGYVNDAREAIIQIALTGENKQLKSIKAIIDTGFSGDLTLPRDVIDALGLTLRGIQKVILADGKMQDFDMFVGTIIWNGQFKRVEINAADTNSLIGMGLLEDYKLELEGRPGGSVIITPLPSIDSIK